MADYTIIADISSYIVRQLRKSMCPSPIPSPNNVEISSPADQEVDYLLGLYLYDMKEEGAISSPPFRRTGQMRLQVPPKPYALYYMLFINGSSQMGLKAPDIQKIIGRTAQVISSNAMVYPKELQSWLENEEPPIVLSAAKISLEEKVRVWQAINKPYQISLFYKAAPVFIASDVIVDIPMVQEAEFTLNLMKQKGES